MDIFKDLELLLYVVVISIVALTAFWWLYCRVASFKTQRVDRIKSMFHDPETLAAMPTDVLSESQERNEKKKIVKGVKTRFTIIQRTLFFSILIVWLFAITAPFIGSIPSTMLSILIAVTTAVVGIAARPLVENMISGIVISFSKQLRVGDTLSMDQQYGTVEDISITHTKIKTWDWKRYVIPNSRMLNKEFVNLTLNDSLLWAYLEFHVSYDADLDEVMKVALEVAENSEYRITQEPPQFWVMRMDKESVVCWVAAWAESPAEAWNLKSDLAINLIKAFRQHGIPAHTSYVDLKGTLSSSPV